MELSELDFDLGGRRASFLEIKEINEVDAEKWKGERNLQTMCIKKRSQMKNCEERLFKKENLIQLVVIPWST